MMPAIMRELIYIMMAMALLSSCQQKEDKNMTSKELMRKAICKPISENLPGKWTMTKSYEKKEGEYRDLLLKD